MSQSYKKYFKNDAYFALLSTYSYFCVVNFVIFLMKIFTTEDIRAIDRYTIDEEGVSSRELIGRVAEGVTCEILSRWRPSRPVTVFAGPGNNGADALAVSKMLYEQGFRPEVLLFNIKGNSLSRDCRACRDELLSLGNVNFIEVTDKMSVPELTPGHLVIDGLFGSGLREPLSGGFMSLVRHINESRATVVSIDVPSGMFGDWNPHSINRNIIHATLTIAIQFPRLAFFIPDNAELVGEWKVIDIGLSATAIRSTPTKYHLVETHDIRRVLRYRPNFSSKADYGDAVLYSGSYGMMGAAMLAAKGALRSGVGKITVHSPRCGFNVLQTGVPEALFQADKNDIIITDMTAPAGRRYTAVGAGPGIGTHDQTMAALETLIKTSKVPLVLDADALNCIARRPALLNSLPDHSVITPHAGEFDRLFGQVPSGESTAESRFLKAVEVARQYNIIVVLKGRYTATIRPDGKVYFNSSGGPAMATPGSGDVLTGIMTSLMAQGYRSELAALTAVFIHGMAGDIAAERHGEYGVTAGDIADSTGIAINTIMNNC